MAVQDLRCCASAFYTVSEMSALTCSLVLFFCLERLGCVDHDVARDRPISFGVVSLGNGFLQLRLNHSLECAAFLNNTIKIGAE